VKRVHELRPEFVEFVPDQLERGVLYISVRYKSVQHSCCCGCGRKVVTPLSPTGWRMTFDGRTVSLSPSVGNWQKECGSHYIIDRNRVHWARQWSAEEISAGLADDRELKARYYSERSGAKAESEGHERKQPKKKSRFRFW
jgi:hypothetical protein